MDHHLIDVVIIGLASWRIANLLVNEDGPMGVFERLRDFVGVKPGPLDELGFLPSLFACIYCMSVWTTILMYLTYQIFPTGVMILAAMSIALIVHKIAKIEY